MNSRYHFEVPAQKRVRYIIHTDAKNEADDQFTIVHALLTQMLDVRAILGGHFESERNGRAPYGTSAMESTKEIHKILDLMGLTGKYRVYCGAPLPLSLPDRPIESDAARFIVEEAMKDDPRPLYIGMQGALTDLASAILLEPRICDRMTCIWVGGNDYPHGGWEFNLSTDIHAANVVFSSAMPLWQIPMGVYKQFGVSLAELEAKVYPCGAIGRYLFEQMVELNNLLGFAPWPHGETWCLGDEGAVCALLQDKERTDGIVSVCAPFIEKDGSYSPRPENRQIRVYRHMDVRLDLEDLFAKLQICYGSRPE